MIALLAVGSKGSMPGFREACLAGVKTIPAYLAFLGACWLFNERLDYRLAVLGGIAVWLVAALAIFLAPRYL
ncbi:MULTISPECIES: GlpM family protein [unclassified Mesorhizobium]|uniref:GlpM family protein n=1 Tax=unclassified Mesorhizobium TaxID=325217 RepID=UPI001FE1311D|nr:MULTISPECIES: GlpM family protein [unclassified Mesorhizobium]